MPIQKNRTGLLSIFEDGIFDDFLWTITLKIYSMLVSGGRNIFQLKNLNLTVATSFDRPEFCYNK